jgi:Na+-translocating ferredoxin:NAD+ oxidoreductase subunit G
MENKKGLQVFQAVILVLVFVVMCALILLLNGVTAPMIEANAQGAELEPLYAVLPEALGFEKLELSCKNTVSSVWKETSGLGYVVRCATNKGYTGDYIELTVAISSDGKISGISLDSYPETKDFGKDTYPQTYIGQNSTLADTAIVAGVTYSSSAFRNAVSDAFETLISNGLIKAGVKDSSQIIAEMLPVVFKTGANPSGIAQTEEFTSSVSGVKGAWKAKNGVGVAYWYSSDADYLVLFNASLDAVVYNLESVDVTSSFDASVISALASEAAGKLSKVSSKDEKKVTKMVPSDSVLTAMDIGNVFNSVSTLFKAESSEGTYYCYTCRPYGFSNETMTIYVVLDENGKIYAFNASELIIEAEYFSGYSLDASSYKAGFVGLDASWSGAEAVVSGATMTTQAVKCAINDAFEAFEAIVGGNN